MYQSLMKIEFQGVYYPETGKTEKNLSARLVNLGFPNKHSIAFTGKVSTL